MQTCQPEDLAARRAANPELVLLDVREHAEREISVLPNDVHIPMGEIVQRYSELNPEAETIVYCRSGRRSADVAEYLQRVGFTRVANLESGINGYADRVDPSLQVY